MTSILEHARTLDPMNLSATEVRKLSREIRKSADAPQVRIAFAGNIVFEPLPERLEAHLACSGIIAATHVAPFDQALQALLDPTSALHAFDPTFLLLHTELDALLSGLRDQREQDIDSAWRRAAAGVLDAMTPVVRAALDSTKAVVLLTNFPEPDSYDLGLADSRCAFGEQDFFAAINAGLRSTFRGEPRVQIIDLRRLIATYGNTRARDRRMYYVAKMPWRDSFLPMIADEVVRHVNTALGRIRKCLVVDLDNTLWGGVLGEDGPLGVRVGADDPVGEAHFDLQRRILAIKRRGVLLAACSKNNPAEVEEIFRVRADMPLRKDDFACMEIGWDMKHEGLQRIAADLNIGLDSLVFLDDNPAEIELIRQLIPEVECVLVPSDPALRPTCLDRVHSLDRAAITAEDLSKTRQYQENAVRNSTQRQFSNLNEYLHSLGTRITIRPATREMLTRGHQLFTKTNQFNVTTRRYSLVELEKFAAEPDSRLLMIHTEDRFGDLGWIGAVLLRGLDSPSAHIDSFVLSCRAMGRGIESAILNHVRSMCFEEMSCTDITAQYIPTARNAPVRDLYEKHGFTIATTSDSGKTYRLTREASAATPCDWISVDAAYERSGWRMAASADC